MFIVLISYTKPLAAVDAHLVAHRAYLERQYAAGVFLLSGRKEPRDGGVILAKADSAAELQAVLQLDPFEVHGIASYQVIEFHPTMSGRGLESLLKP